MHISLSSWFRDYVYIPLGGNRRGVPRQIFNLFVVWMLTGLWHGANWTFILWGLYYGVLLIVEKFVIGKRIEKIPKAIRHIVTLFLVVVGWVLFRADSISDAVTYLGAMFGAGGGDLREFAYLCRQYAIELALCAAAALPIKIWLGERLKRSGAVKLPAQIAVALLAFAVFAVAYMRLVSGSFVPFIYFRF